MGVLGKLRHAWNAFNDQDESTSGNPFDLGGSYGTSPVRTRQRVSNERSIIASIITRLSIDCAAVDMRHVRLDEGGRYIEDIKSGLQECLTVEANIDQGARAFMQDVVMSMLEEGYIAIVAVDVSVNPTETGGFDIKSLRVGSIVQWYPHHIRVRLYNDETGRQEEVTLPKKIVAVVQNPLYSVMNEPNSTLQRIIRKLHLLDAVDEQSSSGKLDMIIQLPYTIKSEARRQQADQRRQDIEFQLKGSQYGIAYTDGTEKITQLNRPAENNLLKSVEYLMAMLYGQLGLTEEVMNGTADEKTMLNYNNRAVEPILGAIAEAEKRAFLTKTARTQGQSIEYFRDPFKLVPMLEFAELVDKLSRNEIASPNEFRAFLGMRPVKDGKSDKLMNSNMPPVPPEVVPGEVVSSTVDDPFASINETLDSVFAELEVPADGGG